MPVITRTEYLEINGVPLATPAWEIVDLSPLWEGAEVRGADRLLPGVIGVRPYRRRATVTVKALRMVIYGDKNLDGVVQADVRLGLWNNIAYLRTNVVDPTNVGNGTRTAILRAPGGITRSGPVHVLSPLKLGADLGPTSVRAVLELSIPGGVLV